MNIFTKYPLRVTIPLWLLVLALLAEGYTIMTDRMQADADEEKEAMAVVTQGMTELQESVTYRLRRGDGEGVQSLMVTRRTNPAITVAALVDGAGTIVCSTEQKLVGSPASQALPEADPARMQEVRATRAGRVFLSGDRRLVTAHYPVSLGTGEGEIRPHRVGILFLAYDLTAAKAARHRDLERQAFLAAGFYGGGLLILGLFLHLVFTRRVRQLVVSARRFAAGDFTVQTGVMGDDELAQMAAAFDTMAAEIAASHATLKLAGAYNRSLIEVSLDPLVTIDAAGTITDVNAATEKVTGYGRDDLVGTDFCDYFTDPGKARAGYEQVFREGTVRDYELEIRHRDGHTTPVLYNASVYRNDAGEVAGVFAAARDISELKRASEALAKRSRQVDAFFSHSLTPFVFLDREFNFIRVNAAYAKGCQREESEFCGHNHFELYPHEENEAIFRRVVETRTPYQAVAKPFAFPDHPEWGVTYWDWTLTPILDGAGEVDFLVFSLNDVTEHERASQRTREQAALIDLAHDAIIVRDVANRIVLWNHGAEELYGWKRDEAEGRISHELLKTRFPSPLGEIETLLLQAGHWEGELHHTTRDGRTIVVESRWVVQRGDTGSPAAFLEINRDITERSRVELELRGIYGELEQRVAERTADLNRKGAELADSQRALMNIVEDLNLKTEELEAANAKLKDLDRLKSMFIASMSHELRTPLNSIIGFSSIIHDEWIGPVNAEQKENLAIIQRSGRHLLNLINDVIDVSKIEAGKIEAVVEEFELRNLVGEAVSLVKKELEEKGLTLRVEAGEGVMRTDRRRLLQCVLNLLSNAVKFTEQGGVTVEARIVPGSDVSPETADAEISVTDTGVGIQQEDQSRMFQPFVRLVSPSQATVPGTGLGLYLSRKLAAEILKGDILLKSEYGRGSCFTLRIPARLP